MSVEPAAWVADLVAEREIRATLGRYCRGLDRLDEDLVRSAYHDPSYADHGIYRGDGYAFAGFVLPLLREGYQATAHVMGNPYIEVLGDAAAVETYCTAYHLRTEPDGGRWMDVIGCRYADRFECRGGWWRIAHRVVAYDWDEVRPVAGRIDPELRARFAPGCRDRRDPSYHILG